MKTRQKDILEVGQATKLKYSHIPDGTKNKGA